MKNVNPVIFLVLALSIMSCHPGNREGVSIEQPNILWITCEDISPLLGCYGDEFAYTPTLDALAGRGVLFSKAFSVASVCTPARSTLITGVYASSMGTQHLRADGRLSENLKCYPEYLREAGYYCSNNVKEDYNFPTPSTVWDESSDSAHWRNRKPGQPFFSIFNFTLTHQSQTRYDEKTLAERNQVLPVEARHAWEDAPVPPYYPDTREVRANIAALYTQITLLDLEVRKLLNQLEEDGLEEETVVFFYSDHGSGLPRGKRWLHDSGTRVPFIVYVPEKLKSLLPYKLGSVVPDLVCFEDLPPTLLKLAGIEIPGYMKGRDILSSGEDKRDCVFTIRDRVDEVYIFSRGVREDKFHYIRNFYPHMPRMPFSGYSEITPIRKEIRLRDREGKLHGDQAWLMQQTTPAEELYDTEADPLEMNNLANDPAYAGVLKRMHKQLRDWMIERRDLSLVPEPEMISMAGGAPAYDIFADKDRSYFETAFDAADKIGRVESAEDLLTGIDHGSEIIRYWSLLALQFLQVQGRDIPLDEVEGLLADPSISVRTKAAELILWELENPKASGVFKAGLDQDDSAARLASAIGLFWLYKHGKIAPAEYQEVLTGSGHAESDIYTYYISNLTSQIIEAINE